MGFSCGIVGLPNVGKSTLFNALTETQAAEAANYPFCTIEPNVGRVAVPDERLQVCARLGKSAKLVPTQLEFVDIAGLVRGASQGQGLGNQFLGHIREVDAIAHVLRCFGDDNVVHVEGSVDPVRVAEAEKRARGGDKEAKALLDIAEPLLAALRDGKPARAAGIPLAELRPLQLLSAKPVLYVANVDEGETAEGNAQSRRVADYAAAQGAGMVVI